MAVTKSFKVIKISLILFLLFLAGCSDLSTTAIIFPEKATPGENLAAHEVRKYIYLRTGKLPDLQSDNAIPPQTQCVIIVGDKNRDFFQSPEFQEIKPAIKKLEPGDFLIKSIKYKKKKMVVIVGGSSSGTLYGAYEFAENMGVRFYLHGDVVPDKKIKFKIPEINQLGTPLFATRGIQPFHDFPEGPDWWSLNDYKAILAQLPKLKMNFIGFHTYPEGGVGPEPTVWIGLPEDLYATGKVKFSYPARHFSTLNGTWGYSPELTKDYNFGASQLFRKNVYATDYMVGKAPWPENTASSNNLFDRTGAFFKKVFTFAHKLGVQTCVGTETPLTLPVALQQHLKQLGKNSADPQVIQEIYQGMFTWIKRNYPLDYFWLWTPENWTWGGNTPQELETTKQDIHSAINANLTVNAPFSLATCGWVLGPAEDRSLFDRFLPENMPVSCINREVGFAPVDTAFSRISGRPKWAIPWLEDDPALTMPQLWAGRMRKDAADALKYGCTGLLGIHWRTRILGPNVSALAKAVWNLSDEQSPPPDSLNKTTRDLPVLDFYIDWAITNFGGNVGDSIAKIFAKLDGTSGVGEKQTRRANLPRPANWMHGPGGIPADSRPWSAVEKNYTFIDQLEKFRPEIKGKGNLERFDYWLNQFKYMKATGELACSLDEFSKIFARVEQVKDNKQRTRLATDSLLPLRVHQMAILQQIYKHLLNSVTTKGGLGNIANWEQHIYTYSLKPQEDSLKKLLQYELPPEAMPSDKYPGEPRIIVPTIRTLLQPGEELKLTILLPGIQVGKASLFWRTLGTGRFKEISLQHDNRSVYSALIPGKEISGDFEYYISISALSGQKYFFPATAPGLNQAVVLLL